MKRVLVAGATGHLGRHIVSALRERGATVRALGRSVERLAAVGAHETHVADPLRPDPLEPALRDVDAVVSCLGASVALSLAGWASYLHVDVPANARLIAAAEAAGVRRFVYVSTHHTEEMRSLGYVRAHEAVAARLRVSSLDAAVVRPTGFHSAYVALLDLARKGPVPLFGDGSARTNPIHDGDLAAVCADLAASSGAEDVVAGGPEVLTRRDIAVLACRAVGKEPSFRPAPPGVARFAGALLRPFHPRLSHLIPFLVAVSTSDCLGPVRGTRRLEETFAEAARALS